MMNALLDRCDGAFSFQNIWADTVSEAVADTQARVDGLRRDLIDCPRSPLLQWDQIFDGLEDTLNLIYLLSNVHPEDEIREACNEAAEFLFSMQSQLILDEEIYQVMCAYAQDPGELDPGASRYLRKIMHDYRQHGFQLSKAGRDRLAEINEALDHLEMEFHRNIGNSRPTMNLTEEETDGLPEDFKSRYRQENGTYTFPVVNPDYEFMLKSLTAESLRKQLYLTFHNRAREENVTILEQLFAKRQEKALLLGFPSYAHFVLSQAMTGTPERVRAFLEEMRVKLLPKSEFDYTMLCREANTASMESYNKFYFTKTYKERKHRFTEQDIKAYFPLEKVVQGLFGMGERLYGIRIEVDDVSVWHPDVKAYRILDEGRVIGRFYLDLVGREGKYDLNTCFSLRNGRMLADGSYQSPESAMLCSFVPSQAETPTLLSHQDITGLFHEFGHLMHHQLTRSPFAMLAGTNVVEDFVEMPSQIMENWAWEPEILTLLSAHYQTGQTIPHDLVEKMIEAKYLNTGINTQQQVFYAALDLELNQIFEPNITRTGELVERLQAHYTMYPMTPETCMEAGFVHLVGYASTYYGYLWSRVYADDMFSVFKQGGILNPELGKRFRCCVLAPGNTLDPMDLVRNFLGREPITDAYMNTLGLREIEKYELGE